MSSESDGNTTDESLPSDAAFLDQEDRLMDQDQSPGLGTDTSEEDIQDLVVEMRHVRQQLETVDARVGSYLSRARSGAGGSVAAGPSGEVLTLVLQRLDEISSQPQTGAPQNSTGADAPADIVAAIQADLEAVAKQQRSVTDGLAQAIAEQFEAQTSILDKLRRGIVRRFDDIAEALRPAPVEEPDLVVDEPASDEWRETLFGPRLVANTGIQEQLDQLQREVLDGDDAALSLVGHLITFRAATQERMPQILKDLGEAFYRCRPKADDETPLETAIKNALQAQLEEANLPNRIELVRAGDRFDATRHNGSGGRTIAQVHGWVVLRDSGRVYTKALVSVE
jgi:hypothetical protein